MSETAGRRLLWVVPEESGGIRTYGDLLGSELTTQSKERLSWEVQVYSGGLPPLDRILEIQPSHLHVQHEYGLFGGKHSPRYGFPAWVNRVRRAFPSIRLVATAHTVLGSDYVNPLSGRRWQIPARWFVNQFLMPHYRDVWGPQTWGALDGVIVHSESQVNVLKASCTGTVRCIPHFVFPPQASMMNGTKQRERKVVVVFGYLTPEKAQDIAISAMRFLDPGVRLILAGGLRRPEDSSYVERCRALIRQFSLEDRVEITGFVPESAIDAIYAQADLVLAPFRTTSGSGSLAQAIARSKPILASDLPLNRELNDRVPGCLATFSSESPESCAEVMSRLLADTQALSKLSSAAGGYAAQYSIPRIAAMHWDFYNQLTR